MSLSVDSFLDEPYRNRVMFMGTPCNTFGAFMLGFSKGMLGVAYQTRAIFDYEDKHFGLACLMIDSGVSYGEERCVTTFDINKAPTVELIRADYEVTQSDNAFVWKKPGVLLDYKLFPVTIVQR